MELGEQRVQLQEPLAGKQKPKCPSARPLLKDRANQLNPPTKPVSKLGHAVRTYKDAARSVVPGAARDSRLVASAPRHTGHSALQKPSDPSVQPRKDAKLPVVPATSNSTQPRGRFPTSGHLNPQKAKPPVREPLGVAAPRTGGDHRLPGVPCAPRGDLQARLDCNKENIRAHAPAHGAPRAAGSQRVLAPKQGSARAALDPKDRTSSRPATGLPGPDTSRKTPPVPKLSAQNPAARPRPGQQPLPSRSAAAGFLHKKPAMSQDRPSAAAVLPAAYPRQRHSRTPPAKRSPAKPLAASRPRGATTTTLKPSLKVAGAAPRQRAPAKGLADGKGVPPGRPAAAPRGPVPPQQPRGTSGPGLQANGGDSRSRVKPVPAKAGAVWAWRIPKTPSAADRKRQLAEWLASKGKTYKRPPMMLLQKQPVKLSCRTKEENEKRREPEQPSLEKIRHLLTECLKLVEEGAQAEDILALLSRVPQAEKFSTFWICRAKLLARSGPFDVTGLYKAAVCAGATPLEELREVVLGILKATAPPSEGEKPEQPLPWDSATPPAGEGRRQAVTPCPTGSALTSLPASIKLQVTSAPRPAEAADARELRFVTPVRRSLRIGRAGGRYPPMLKDHDPVVASLSEALAAEEEAPRLLFRRNKALPEVPGLEGLSSCSPTLRC